MAQRVRFGTARGVIIGPAIATGGHLPVTTLTATGVTAYKIIKNGATVAVNLATGHALTHIADGHYRVPLVSNDVGSYGHLRVLVRASGTVKSLAFWQDFEVVSANIYDSRASGTTKQNVGTLTSAAVVWTAAARTLTSGGAVSDSVWVETARTLTSAAVVWTAAARGLTSKVGYALTSAQHDSIGTRTWQTQLTQVTGAPTVASGTAAVKLGFVYVAARNKRITTATGDKIHNSVSVGIAKAPITAGTGSFTRGKYVSVTG